MRVEVGISKGVKSLPPINCIFRRGGDMATLLYLIGQKATAARVIDNLLKSMYHRERQRL